MKTWDDYKDHAKAVDAEAKKDIEDMEKIRCPWAGNIPIYISYHDNEWGRPLHDDNRLFELLVLEGMPGGAQLDHHPQEEGGIPGGFRWL